MRHMPPHEDTQHMLQRKIDRMVNKTLRRRTLPKNTKAFTTCKTTIYKNADLPLGPYSVHGHRGMDDGPSL
jgi:hypothetical protein